MAPAMKNSVTTAEIAFPASGETGGALAAK